MPTTKQKSKIITAAALSAIMVGSINTVGGLVAYNLIVPAKNTEQITLISNNTEEFSPLPEPTQQPSNESNNPKDSASSNRPLRQTNTPLTVGQTPLPTAIITDSNGQQKYRWCSGVNPELDDGVCQAIISIAANPTESNPHLGKNAKESLSLLPRDVSLVMDENSWQQTSPTSGSMYVNAKTSDYGDVRLKIFMDKQDNIWVLTDGQLA